MFSYFAIPGGGAGHSRIPAPNQGKIEHCSSSIAALAFDLT